VGQVVRMSLLVVKFDSLDERSVKFERKSLNLSPCKRQALPVCEVNFNRVPYAVGTLGGCRERLRFRSEVGLCSAEK